MAQLPEQPPKGMSDRTAVKPSSSSENPLIVQHGERAFICGMTGSGKTTFAIWQLMHIEQSPIIIYDTKGEPKFEALPASVVVEDFPSILKAIQKDEHDYIIVRPPADVFTSPERLDKLLMEHYLYLQGHVAYIDEVATFHRNAITGTGLANLLQRGRSKGITLIMSTQRPARISRSCVSESQKFFIFRLRDRRDRKIFDEIIEEYSKLYNPPKHYFYFDEDDGEKPVLYRPVKLEAEFDTGYTDGSQSSGDADPKKETPRERALKKETWI